MYLCIFLDDAFQVKTKFFNAIFRILFNGFSFSLKLKSYAKKYQMHLIQAKPYVKWKQKNRIKKVYESALSFLNDFMYLLLVSIFEQKMGLHVASNILDSVDIGHIVEQESFSEFHQYA